MAGTQHTTVKRAIYLHVMWVRVRMRGTCIPKNRTHEKCTWCHPFARNHVSMRDPCSCRIAQWAIFHRYGHAHGHAHVTHTDHVQLDGLLEHLQQASWKCPPNDSREGSYCTTWRRVLNKGPLIWMAMKALALSGSSQDQHVWIDNGNL